MLLCEYINVGEYMKAITLEMLLAKRELLNDKRNIQCSYLDGKKYLINELIETCKEIDTLTFSKLRPMSEAPINIPILAKYIKSDELLSIRLSADSKFRCYEGWLPMPIYKPEKE
jgi:hypothetical protein